MFKSPIFILGYPRSGTTLLRALLGAHSKVHLINEPELIRGMCIAGIDFAERVKRENLPQMLEKLQQLNVCRQHFSSLDTKILQEFLDQPKDLSFKDIYEFLLPKSEQAEVWGEKSLGNVFYIKELNNLYPNAIFIHIIRDPRAALLSYYRKKFAGAANCLPELSRRNIRFFAHSAIRWRRRLSFVNTAQNLLGSNTIIQLKFNDLVTEPEKELSRICSHIKIEFEPKMMDASRRKEDSVILKNAHGAYAHKNLNQPINPKRADAGKELPGWASYIVEKYTADNLMSLGFGLKKEPVNLMQKTKITIELHLAEKKLQAKANKEMNYRKAIINEIKV